MGSSLIFDTVVGMVFVFAIFTFAVSGVVEGLARLAGLRAEFLLRGISSMLDSDTKFEKGWVARLAQKAIDEQGKGAQDAVLDAEAKLGDLPAGAPARDKITTALEKAKAIVPPHRRLTDATNMVTSAEKSLKDLPKNADAATTAAATTAVAEARKERTDAEEALTTWLAHNPTPAEITDAKTAIDAVPPLLAHAQTQIDTSRPPGVGVETAVTTLAASRRLFLPAQQALEAAQGNRQAVSAASLISEPIVDLTAALNIPKRLESQPTNKKMSWRTKRNLPSYLSSRTFSSALVHALVPSPVDGTTTFDQLKSAVDGVGDDKLRKVLRGQIDEAQQDVDKFRVAVQGWYDDHMQRVAGWYKRHTRWYTLAVAAVLAFAFNVNAVAMAQALYTDQALRESVVTAAFDAADCTANDADTTPAECLQDVRGQIDRLRGTGLPIGWSRNAACVIVKNSGEPATESNCSLLNEMGLTDTSLVSEDEKVGVSAFRGFLLDVRQLGLVLLGWAVIAATALVGARFWFDALSKLGSLRSSGPKPDSSV